MSAIIHDRQITCPHCHRSVQVKRQSGSGATYVAKWIKLPKRCNDVAWYWLTDPHLLEPVTKTALRHRLVQRGLKISEDSINARVSELLGCGLCEMSQTPDLTQHDSRRTPRYALNRDRTQAVLKTGRL